MVTNHRPKQNIYSQFLKKIQQYKLIHEIGQGAYGKVYFTVDDCDKKYATKAIEMKILRDGRLEQCFQNELSIIKSLDHPNIVRYEDFKETPNNKYVILEYCNGFPLNKLIDHYKYSKPDPIVREKQIQHISRQLCSALKYIADKNILHRDLKLENVLLHFDSEEAKMKKDILSSHVKLIDFGFSRRINLNSVAKTICGSPLNMAPQILAHLEDTSICEGYDTKADVWSYGSMIFNLVFLQPPFSANSCQELKRKIKEGICNLPEDCIISLQCLQLLYGILQNAPEDRLNWDQINNAEFHTCDVQNFKFEKLTKSQNYQIDIHKNIFENLFPLSDTLKNEVTKLVQVQIKMIPNNKERDNQERNPNSELDLKGRDSEEFTKLADNKPLIMNQPIEHQRVDNENRSQIKIKKPIFQNPKPLTVDGKLHAQKKDSLITEKASQPSVNQFPKQKFNGVSWNKQNKEVTPQQEQTKQEEPLIYHHQESIKEEKTPNVKIKQVMIEEDDSNEENYHSSQMKEETQDHIITQEEMMEDFKSMTIDFKNDTYCFPYQEAIYIKSSSFMNVRGSFFK